MRPCALLLLLLASACAPDQAGTDEAPDTRSGDGVLPDNSAVVWPAAPRELPLVASWRARIPTEAFVRPGACPFECCVYGDWKAESEIAVQEDARRDAAVRFRIGSGQALRADSGKVLVTGIMLLAVRDTITTWMDSAPAPLGVGDTLVLLDHVGEGHFNVWHEGGVRETEGFWSPPHDTLRVERIGSYQADWWVHATLADGRRGWFLADSVELRGADACAGPV